MGSLGSGLNDPWVAKGSDPWARLNNRMNTGLEPIGSDANVPSPFEQFICGKWMCDADGSPRAVFSDKTCSDFIYSSKPSLLQSGFGTECRQCDSW